MKPFYPQSSMIRLARDRDGLQIDFMSVVDGVRSFEGLRNRAEHVRIGEARLLVAGLPDIVKSKKAAARPQDLAAIPVLEKTLEEKTRNTKREAGSSEDRE
jgi:hypothetical protein